ncbi:RHS repeat-associated core domain-containing protein [Pedobacter sp. PF22-3]|uniref:RHS repeat domain-containing protein n=1 Tax=Pedobacter sp. PF22-3 TaxID=2994467 RepID=UPI002247A9A5|nr:RHS repeat-associated core domain-containing protein [Pedobacter sp. PF22-3]MCX2491836.1 RHS repeat-associated core domain-containing protein [Pedobacter sp. PF22-3]
MIARNIPGGNYSYEYNLSDNLGNVRVTFKQSPITPYSLEVIQRDDYFAFGLRKEPVAKAGLNKYLYNGKELQEELGQYDYGVRFYDPVVGRFNSIDSMSEKFDLLSPYNYVANNPIMLNDPTGKDWSITINVDKDSRTHYNILFTGAVVDNTSKHNGQADKVAKAIKTQFEALFNKNVDKDENGGTGFVVTAKAEINVYDDAKSVGYKETLFNIKDRTDEDFNVEGGGVVGRAMNGKVISLNEEHVDMLVNQWQE